MTIEKPVVFRVLTVTLCCALAGLSRPWSAHAQSLTSGSIAGVVRDEAGLPVPDVSVALIDDVTGARQIRITPRNGVFRFPLLGPAEYQLLIERFGFRPRLYVGVPVLAGSEALADLVLQRETGAETVDTLPFPGAPARGMMLSLERGASRDFAWLADPAGLLLEAALLLPGADGAGGAAGLPGRFGAVAMDGVPHRAARHPLLASADFDALAFPTPVVRSIELLSRELDAEWSGVGGGILAGTTRPGTRQGSAVLRAAGGPDLQTASLVVAGPIMRDTAQYALGFNAARLRPAYPAQWSDSAGAKIASIAQDSFGTSLASRLTDVSGALDVYSGFGSFAWSISERQHLGVRASAGLANGDEVPLGPYDAVGSGSSLKARQLSIAAALSSALGTRAASELRVSFDVGSRSYAGSTLPRTVFAEGLVAGTSALVPGTFKRNTFRFAETFHFRIRPGSLKAGVEASSSGHELTFGENRAGTFYFGDTTGFATGNGIFTQAVGAPPVASFRTNELGVFLQALLRVTPAMELRTSVRYDTRTLPVGDVPLNTEWANLTGLDNRAARATYGSIAPRFSFTWTPGANRGWSVNGDAGISSESVDPAILAEALTRAGGMSMRRAAGAVGTWPAIPDSTIAPVRGRVLTLLGPDFAMPRTGRLGLGITGSLGGTLLVVQGLYRHTDYLPLRRDLNLVSNAANRDQYGRPLHGTLSRQGALLAAVPGSNRRFSTFDAVTSLDPAGASDYYGVTLELRRNLGRRFDLLASYTFSSTRDNWFGARDGTIEGTQLPFPDSAGSDSWIQGVSDFDVPHRLVLGAQLKLSGAVAPRIGILYRMQSGFPYTPGFREGVDANADGSARNDPAFVTDTVANAATVIAGNGCLRAQVGRLAERNSCREPSISSLDLTLAFTVWSRGGRSAELVADVIGAVRGGYDRTDRALYLVDATRPLTTSAAGVTAVPLVANTNFGGALGSRDPGALWRIGLRVGL